MEKRLWLSVALSPLLGTAAQARAGNMPEQTKQRPNILLFMVDDMGWQDTSLPFWNRRTPSNDTFETPNMERLAAKGMMFTQAYACNVSSPTRCSLMTGADAARHRVTNWTLAKDTPTDAPSDNVLPPEWNCNGISRVEGTPRAFVGTSFVERLRESGYCTIHCGKAHFGAVDTPGENPIHWGFEVNIAGSAIGGPATYLSERNFGHSRDGKPLSPFAIPGLQDYWGTGVFATEALTQEAMKALDKAKAYNQPFFLYMAHYAVHVPIDKDMRFFPKYVRKGLSDKEAAYAALVEGMDKSLGDLLDWLDANGEADNTVVIFMSDNGGLAAAPAWRDGEPHTQNAPLRSGKGSLYEGGIREPMIVRWPGVVAANSRCDKYLKIEDFYPTLLEMAGIQDDTLPDTVDGVSFMPLLDGSGDPSAGRALVWNFPNIWDLDGPGINLNCAIRQDEWKLVYDYETGEKELFNIPQDIGEQDNVAGQHPDIVQRLSRELGEYLRRVDGQRPTFKATGKPCPWPDEV